MSSHKKFDIYGYTPDKLANARNYEIRISGHLSYIVCPHCHTKVDSLPMRTRDPDNGSIFSSNTDRMPGAELKCCPNCGGVFLDPRFREAAIGGFKKHKRNSTIAKLAVMIVIAIALSIYGACSISSGFSGFGGYDIDAVSVRTLIVFLILIVILGAVFYYIKTEGLYNSRNELGSSRARLKNPDYLRALQRLGRPLPVKYLNLINGTSDENRIYRVLSGSCEFCGFFLKKPEMCRHFERPLATCPQCRMLTYDDRLCELAVYPPEMQREIFSAVAGGIGAAMKFEEKKALKFGVAAAAGFLILGVLVYFIFFAPLAPGLFGYSAAFPGKLRFLMLVISAMAVFIGGYGSCQALLRMGKLRKFGHVSFESELRKSEKRLGDPDYAGKVRTACSLYEKEVPPAQ